MARGKRLTALAIERAKPAASDYWLTDDEGTRGGGRLVLRVGSSGSKLFYYRYSVDGARKQIPLRPFTPQPVDGRYTLEQAREVGRAHGELHRRRESHDVAVYLREQETKAAATREAERAASSIAKAAVDEAADRTVLRLCEWYVEHLRRMGKVSVNDVRSIFAKHLGGTDWASCPAASFTSKQAAALFRSVVDQGKGRTAGKLRAYMRSAFALALKAELDPTAPEELILFGVSRNPVADTAALSKFNKTRERALVPSELGALWRRLAEDSGQPLAQTAMRLSLLLGGQRVTQLLRARMADVDLEARRITLWDGKGRRAAPRAHVLPLCDGAAGLVQLLVERSQGRGSAWLFASGRVALVPKTVLCDEPDDVAFALC